MEINVGKIKAMMDRQRQYISMLNFLMLAYLFFKEVGFQWWYLLVIPVWLIFVYIDLRYIMPSEYNYVWGKNPAYKRLLEDR